MGVERVVQPCCHAEHFLLLLDGVIDVLLRHKAAQRRVRHKAEAEIGAAAQQQDIAGLRGDGRVGRVALLAVAVNEVFEAAHQIRERAALIIEVAVACGPRGQTERTAEAVEADVCRRGEDGNTTVAVERGVIERLVGRDLHAAAALGHGLQNGLHILRLAWIGRAGRERDLCHAHGDAADHFCPDDGKQQRHAEELPPALRAIQHERKAYNGQRQRAQEHPAQAALQPQPAQDNAETDGKDDEQISLAEAVQQRPRTVGHDDEHKAEQEAEAIGEHIGEMPAVPVIIQRAEQEAQQEEGEKADAQELFPQADLFAAQEEYGQRHGGKATVNIRQAFHLRRLRRGEQIGQHAARAVGEARQRLLLQQVQRALALRGLAGGVLCDVQRQQLRRFVPGGVGVLQAVERRQQQNGCHADAEQRAQRDAAEAAEKALPAVPAADAPDKEAQPDKDAAEKRKIVVAQQRECQRQRIQAEAALAQQADHARQHQRQEGQRIEPDDVPIVARHKGAQGVHHGKRHERRLVPAERRPQEDGEEQTGQSDLRQNEQREEFPQQRRRDQHGQKIEGT